MDLSIVWIHVLTQFFPPSQIGFLYLVLCTDKPRNMAPSSQRCVGGTQEDAAERARQERDLAIMEAMEVSSWHAPESRFPRRLLFL